MEKLFRQEPVLSTSKMHKIKTYRIVGRISPDKALQKLQIKYKSFKEAKQFATKLKHKYPTAYFEIWKLEEIITIYKLK